MRQRRSKIHGSSNWRYGYYELKKTLHWLAPIAATMVASFLATQVCPALAEQGGWAEVAGGVIAVSLKAIHLLVANNQSKEA